MHFHWSYETIMNMEHQERREWAEQIARIIGAWNHEAASTARAGAAMWMVDHGIASA